MTWRFPTLAWVFCLHAAAAFGQDDRRVRVLARDESPHPPNAHAAAPSNEQRGSAPTSFAGVFVGSREVREATDRVISATKLAASSGASGKVPFSIARRGEPCPECDEARAAETWSFTMFRTTPDSAYVGAEISSMDRGKRSTCIALARVGNTWLVSRTTSIRNAKGCGE
jgi:hypothetical protein